MGACQDEGPKGKGNEWLIIKKKDEAAQPGWDIEQYAFSVKTGRTQAEIAADLPAKKTVRKKTAAPRKKKSAGRGPWNDSGRSSAPDARFLRPHGGVRRRRHSARR